MKILHVINNLDAGGAQKLVADLAMLQDDLEDTEVEIATILPEGEALFGKWLASHSSIKIHHFSFRKPFSPASVTKLRNLFRDFDLIHAHLFPSVYLCALAITGISKPMVYTEHSTSNRRRDHKILLPVEKMVYARYDAIACISEATKENLLKWLDNSRISKRTVVIHNGVDNRKYELGTPFPVSEIF